MLRRPLLATILLLSACGQEEESTSAAPAAPTFDLVIEVDAPVTETGRGLTERALRGLPLSWEGRALGELGTIRPTVFGARFQAPLEPGAHTFTARAPTPCGPRDVPIATWTITAAQVRPSSIMGPASERFALGYDDLTVRHVYVIGGDAQTPVHVGEIELPGGTGQHVVFSQGCDEALVRVGTEPLGTWRPSGPTIINLEPTACQRYEVRTLSASGYTRRGDVIRVVRPRSAETLPPNTEPSHPIDHFMEPLPESVMRRVSEGALTLAGVVSVTCPTEEEAAAGDVDEGSVPATTEPPARRSAPSRTRRPRPPALDLGTGI